MRDSSQDTRDARPFERSRHEEPCTSAVSIDSSTERPSGWSRIVPAMFPASDSLRVTARSTLTCRSDRDTVPFTSWSAWPNATIETAWPSMRAVELRTASKLGATSYEAVAESAVTSVAANRSIVAVPVKRGEPGGPVIWPLVVMTPDIEDPATSWSRSTICARDGVVELRRFIGLELDSTRATGVQRGAGYLDGGHRQRAVGQLAFETSRHRSRHRAP